MAAPTIPGYRILQSLGSGGFAEVWQAEHELMGRVFAVKVLHSAEVFAASARQSGGSGSDYASIVARFITEAGTLARLQHKHVIRFFELREAVDGRPCLSLEFCTESLAARLGMIGAGAAGSAGQLSSAQSQLGWREAVGVACQLLEALEYLHTRECIHRDIKPANVLLGTDGRWKLSDFGLVRDLSAAGRRRSTRVMGTVEYMAPEARRGEAEFRSDLWSVGALLYRCLTGEDYIGGLDGLEDEWPDIPGSLWLSLGHALHRRPENRFDRASSMAAALGAVLAGEAGAPSLSKSVVRMDWSPKDAAGVHPTPEGEKRVAPRQTVAVSRQRLVDLLTVRLYALRAAPPRAPAPRSTKTPRSTGRPTKPPAAKPAKSSVKKSSAGKSVPVASGQQARQRKKPAGKKSGWNVAVERDRLRDGTKVSLWPEWSDRFIVVDIKPGTRPGEKIRLEGRGKDDGDLIVHVHAVDSPEGTRVRLDNLIGRASRRKTPQPGVVKALGRLRGYPPAEDQALQAVRSRTERICEERGKAVSNADSWGALLLLGGTAVWLIAMVVLVITTWRPWPAAVFFSLLGSALCVGAWSWAIKRDEARWGSFTAELLQPYPAGSHERTEAVVFAIEKLAVNFDGGGVWEAMARAINGPQRTP